MFPTPQESALVTLSGLLSWIIGHQGSHCFALQAGRAELNLMLAGITGAETFSGALFLGWYVYMEGIAAALWLIVVSFIFRLALIRIQNMVGLTQRAWVISLAGIPLVPVLIGALVWLVLHPISN